MPNLKTKTVSVRIEQEFYDLLVTESEAEGKKLTDVARRHLVRGLTGSESTELREDLKSLQKDFRKLRDDLATLSNVLLVKVAKVGPDEAEKWVRQNFEP